MKLTSFRVHDFRSINDSTEIDVSDRTAIVGRNESGKSSLLRVLYALKPAAQQLQAFTLARDFPRDRSRKDYKDSIKVLETTWTLTATQQTQLATVWKRGKGVTQLEVGRYYKATRYVNFIGALPLSDWAATIGHERKNLSIVAAKAKAAGSGAVATAFDAADDALSKLESTLKTNIDATTTANAATAALTALKAAIGSDPTLSAEAANALKTLESVSADAASDKDAAQKARTWVMDTAMPSFVYLDDFESVPGHYHIDQYVSRVANTQQNADDRLFAKLLKVAELDAKELHNLLGQNHEERKLLTDRASRLVTKTLRELWKDRKIDVQFSVDAGHFDVLVSDVDTNALVPLDERSRGFRWYFSFFITFAADTKGGDKSEAVLLLDEPGLFLHATAQESLLNLFKKLGNQILYTTHSPFMISIKELDAVRTVNLAEGAGTVVTNNPTGDANTLFPLQAALGYDLTQTMFIGGKNLVVEGVTDFWYLSSVSAYLRDSSRPALERELTLTPAGGAQKVSYMVALLASQKLEVALLLDSEPKAEQTRKELLSSKLIRDHGIVRVAEAFGAAAPVEADIEDLISPDVFMKLVEETYKKDIAGRPLTLNANIPRIVKRVEDAFTHLGLEFNKTRVARKFLANMGAAPTDMLKDGAMERFELLCTLINESVEKVAKHSSAF